jgi:hypothetical protein
VKRGDWVLHQILCSETPPPPPGVEGLIDEPDETATLRERLEVHRADPACAGCHSLIDPLGFGLENFDGIGAWREDENGLPLDSSGELPGGIAFDGVKEMSEVIAADERYPACVAEHMFVYALGRGMEGYDEEAMTAILGDWEASGQGLRSLVKTIVTSDAFTMRRGGQ